MSFLKGGPVNGEVSSITSKPINSDAKKTILKGVPKVLCTSKCFVISPQNPIILYISGP